MIVSRRHHIVMATECEFLTDNKLRRIVSNITNEQPVEYVQKLAMFSDPRNNI